MPTDRDTIVYHLRRSFSTGDQNYDAQFWYGVYMFQDAYPERRAESKQIFRQLRVRPALRDVKEKIREVIKNNDATIEFAGRIAKLEASYGFIEREGLGDWIFLHRRVVGSAAWERLRSGQRVWFKIGFTYGGPQGS